MTCWCLASPDSSVLFLGPNRETGVENPAGYTLYHNGMSHGFVFGKFLNVFSQSSSFTTLGRLATCFLMYLYSLRQVFLNRYECGML